MLRLFSGPYADRGGRYWSLTIVGYAMTAVCVPLLAVTPFVGSLGLALAATLILLERAGKAIRSPSKTALLARVAVSVGRGRGFAVHKALDQVGAFAGPLLVAGVIALVGATWPAFAVLAVPGAVCMLLLFTLKRHSAATEPAGTVAAPRHGRGTGEHDRRTAGPVDAVLRVRHLVRPGDAGADDVRGHLLPPRGRRAGQPLRWCR